MKRIIITLVLISPLLMISKKGNSQIINYPVWTSKTVYFETAKIRLNDPKTNKFLPEIYKTSNITIENADGEFAKITIDIPDNFYIKSLLLTSTEFKKDADDNTTITYIINDGIKYASMSVHFPYLSNEPDFISVTATENINMKPIKTKSFMLTEFK